jgi:hypothetical protein
MGRLFFQCPARDFHCGLRGFARASVPRMDLRTTGMEFASEMVIKATLQGMRIAEVPTTLSPDGRSRPPHLRTWRDGWRHLRFMLLFSPNWLFVYPGLVMILIGLGVGARLAIAGPLHVGRVNFDVQTMLFAATATIVGFQAFLFGTFAKTFGVSTGLLPPNSRLGRLSDFIPLEWGLVAGLVLFLLGLCGAVYSVGYWARSSFGPLDPLTTLRFVTPSVTAMILAGQLILGSFFLGLLRMGRRG